MTKETCFEKLPYTLRRRELSPRTAEEKGLLPVVEWDGRNCWQRWDDSYLEQPGMALAAEGRGCSSDASRPPRKSCVKLWQPGERGSASLRCPGRFM